MQHIFTGDGPPSFTPPGVGHHYIDMTAKLHYVSVGVASVNDWKTTSIVNSAKKQNIVLTTQNVTNQYIDLDFKAVDNSITLFVTGILYVEGIHYSVTENLEQKSRISFLGDLAAGGRSNIEEGEIVHLQYLTL